jgi:hypothetical protein
MSVERPHYSELESAFKKYTAGDALSDRDLLIMKHALDQLITIMRAMGEHGVIMAGFNLRLQSIEGYIFARERNKEKS